VKEMIAERSRVQRNENITVLAEMNDEKANEFKKAVRDLAHRLQVSYKFVNLEGSILQDLDNQELE
jgi:hypothetical protein